MKNIHLFLVHLTERPSLNMACHAATFSSITNKYKPLLYTETNFLLVYALIQQHCEYQLELSPSKQENVRIFKLSWSGSFQCMLELFWFRPGLF